MSKAISKIGRTFDKVIKKTGVKKLYEKTVPSSIRRAASKAWNKIRKPVLTAVAIYFTAGAAAAVMGGTTLAGGFAAVNSGIAGAFGGGAAASAGAGAAGGSAGTGLLTSTGSIAGTAGATGTVSAATTAATGGAAAGSAALGGSGATGLITSTGSIAGTAGATGAVSGATTAATGGSLAGSATLAAPSSSAGFFGALKAGNYGQAAMQGGKSVMSGAGKVWNAATANSGSALLASSVLQGYGATQQQKRQDRREEELRNRRTWYGMDGQGGFSDFSQGPGLLQMEAPQLSQSTSLDDLIKRRKEGYA